MEFRDSFDNPCENDSPLENGYESEKNNPLFDDEDATNEPPPDLPMEVTDEVVRYYSPMVYRIALTKTQSSDSLCQGKKFNIYKKCHKYCRAYIKCSTQKSLKLSATFRDI